eukprot:1160534-Pelagomonas_calceolata.AAC.26
MLAISGAGIHSLQHLHADCQVENRECALKGTQQPKSKMNITQPSKGCINYAVRCAHHKMNISRGKPLPVRHVTVSDRLEFEEKPSAKRHDC